MKNETEKLEFKAELTGDIYKEVVAFVNTDGGTIFIGINDFGEEVGIEDIDDKYTKITNGIRDAILPDVTMFVKYMIENDKIIRIEVGEGTYKPYHLKSKGLKPSGVYVRQGTSSFQASPEQMRRMIKSTDGDIFEEMHSLEQNLTFDSATKAFLECNTEFDGDKYCALGVRNSTKSQYTNLALVISDQCNHTIKVGVFSDDNMVFKARKEFAGSVFAQLEEAFSYLQLCNQNRSEIEGLVRKDYWSYPLEAIREALINAVIHRDYSFSGSIIINVNDSSMEFISIGGLPSELLVEDIKNGISQPRNRKLANIFHRLNLIESYGTGIRRIYKSYEYCAKQPQIEVTPNSFKIVLPNMNASYSANKSEYNIREGLGNSFDKEKKLAMTPQMQELIEYITKYGEATECQAQEVFGVKRTRAYILTKKMVDMDLIRIIGRGINKKYILYGDQRGKRKW